MINNDKMGAVSQQNSSNTVIFQNTFSKEWFKRDLDDLQDSRTYYHFPDFEFPEDMPEGEYRYYVFEFMDGEITVQNNKIYLDGEEVRPEASGLLQYGEYQTNITQEENNMTEYIQYEG